MTEQNSGRRPLNVRIYPNAMAPLAHEDGTLRSGIGAFTPVLDACQYCAARCCRMKVNISLGDALYFCRALQVPFFAGLVIVPSDHPKHAFRLTPEPSDPRLQLGWSEWLGWGEIALARREDGGCHALVNIGGHERCGVYAARPSFCRTYPFNWTSDQYKGSIGAQYCPVPYGVTPRQEAQGIEDIERSIELWQAHDEVVAEWNEAHHEAEPLDQFLDFALLRTAQRLGMAMEGVLDHRPQAARLFEAMVRSGIIGRRGPHSPG